MGLDINLNTSKIDISEEDGLNVDLYNDNIDVSDNEADDIIIEITGLKSINKFIGLEDTPLYYENGRFFKVEDNKIIYTDIQWKDISGNLEDAPEIIDLIKELVKRINEEVIHDYINQHNDSQFAHPYIQNIIQGNYNTLDTKINDTKEELSEVLNTEIINRETADNALSEDIQEEILSRIEGDTTLQNNIDTLTNNLNIEIENRTNADNLLRDDIDNISGELAQEIIDRQTQDNLLQEQITSNYNTLDNKIDTEISDRISADETLQNNIDTEALARQNADATLQSNIDTLSNTVSDNYTDLDGKISDLTDTVNDNDTAINNKVDGINTTLTNNINSLSNTVSSNYTALDTKIDNTKTSLEGDISNLSDTVSQNYTDLNNAITTSASTINSRIDSEVSTLNTAIDTETTNRQNADNNLQSQIDAIVSSSDVFDIVGTYAELQAYDISTVPVNDIIKVLVDSSHDNSATYYRCIETVGVKSWSYIGSEGAYYTKSESDTKFVAKTTTINNKPLSSNITLTASDVNALPNTTVIGNGVLTLQKNGVNIDTFNANATANKSINITVPTDTADLTNGAGFITATSLPTVNNGTLIIQANGITVGTFTANQEGNTTANIVVPDSATWGNITGTLSNQTDLQNALDNKYDASNPNGFISSITSSDITTALGYTPYNATNPAGYTSNVGTVTSVNNIQPDTNGNITITIPDTATWGNITGTLANQTDLQNVLNTKQNTISDLSTIRSGASAGATALQPNDNISELNNNAGYITSSALNGYATESFVTSQGYITGITSSDITTSLGYTPYNATNPNGFISSASISSLTDVDLTSIANNQALLYNSTTQKWENKDVTITVDSALDNTSTNPVENRVIAQALEGISLAKNPNLNLIGGNLNIDSGNVSEFSTADYMQFPFVFNFNGYTWTLEIGFTTGSDVTTQQNILDSYYGVAFAIRNGKFVLAISYNGSSWNIANTEGTYSVQANTAYSVKIAWDGSNYTLSYALDETNYTTDISIASTEIHHSTQEYVGGEPELFGSGSQHPFAGTINLNNWKLTVNGLEVWLGMDDVGLGSRANIDLSNLTEAGQYMVDTVKDQNDGSRIKTWTGTKAQYEAIATKDATTLYNIIDDTDVTLPLLELLFPVGAVYFGTMSVCPLQVLGVGTWQALPQDKVIQIAGTRGSVGDTLNESLPNITGEKRLSWSESTGVAGSVPLDSNQSGALYHKTRSGNVTWTNASSSGTGIPDVLAFDASRSSSTYQDDAPVQQDAYLLNGWRRIS